MKHAVFAVALCGAFIELQAVWATTFTVGTAGGYDFGNIQSAIDSASNYDTILVYPGVYTGAGNRDIDFKGKAVTVRSTDGPYSTIIDCQGTQQSPHRGFSFHSAEGNSSVVSGFSVVNGYSPEDYVDANKRSAGGAVFCYNASPSISNCVFKNNTAYLFGAAIVCAQNSSPILTNLVINNNTSQNRGGGVYCFWYSSPVIKNCTIADNSASILGGGLYAESYSRPSVYNSIVWGNRASFNTGQIYSTEGSMQVLYSDVQNGWAGSGNINSDPLFTSDGRFNLTLNSPCIDAGSNYGVSYDIMGNPRPVDIPGINDGSWAPFDMGAYEVPEPATVGMLALGGIILRKLKIKS
jgi:hypothetical protein